MSKQDGTLQFASVSIRLAKTSMYLKSIKLSGIWEKHLMMIFQNLLKKDSEYGVIDIGANLGQYALLGAKMGRPVVDVEARLLHVEMIHHALQLNNLRNSTFILLHNAVSDNHNQLTLRLTESYNQGHTQIVERGQNGGGVGIPTSEVTKVPAILMNDIAEVVDFSKAIIKMDIEGSENRAISHCETLLQKVYVPFLFMEWLFKKNMAEGQQLILKILTRNGYSAFSLDKRELKIADIKTWPMDIIWKHKNATFTLKILTLPICLTIHVTILCFSGRDENICITLNVHFTL